MSTYDHVHGALDGAAVGGAIGFTLGFAAGSLLIRQTCNDDGSCDTSIPAATRLRWGTAVGAQWRGHRRARRRDWRIQRPDARIEDAALKAIALGLGAG